MMARRGRPMMCHRRTPSAIAERVCSPIPIAAAAGTAYVCVVCSVDKAPHSMALPDISAVRAVWHTRPALRLVLVCGGKLYRKGWARVRHMHSHVEIGGAGGVGMGRAALACGLPSSVCGGMCVWDCWGAHAILGWLTVTLVWSRTHSVSDEPPLRVELALRHTRRGQRQRAGEHVPSLILSIPSPSPSPDSEGHRNLRRKDNQ